MKSDSSNQEIVADLDMSRDAAPTGRLVGTSRGTSRHAKPTTSFRRRVRKTIESGGLALFLLVLIGGFSVALPKSFPHAGNFSAMVSSQAVLLILAFAVTIPLRAGEFDLSIGSVMIASAALATMLTNAGMPFAVGVVVALALGIALGGLNAVLVVAIGVDGFVATLGTMTAVGAVAVAITRSQTPIVISKGLLWLGGHDVFGLPVCAYIGWLLGAVLLYLYEFTPLGRRLLVTGRSREAARELGVETQWYRAMAYVSAGALSALAGLVFAGSYGSVDPSVGTSFLLQPYAAVFLGTTSVRPGEFNVLGTLIALYVLVVGSTGLQLLGLASWVGDLFNGIALLAALIFTRLTARRASAFA